MSWSFRALRLRGVGQRVRTLSTWPGPPSRRPALSSATSPGRAGTLRLKATGGIVVGVIFAVGAWFAWSTAQAAGRGAQRPIKLACGEELTVATRWLAPVSPPGGARRLGLRHVRPPGHHWARYYRAGRPRAARSEKNLAPTIWIHDSHRRWHATRVDKYQEVDVTMHLQVVPALALASTFLASSQLASARRCRCADSKFQAERTGVVHASAGLPRHFRLAMWTMPITQDHSAESSEPLRPRGSPCGSPVTAASAGRTVRRSHASFPGNQVYQLAACPRHGHATPQPTKGRCRGRTGHRLGLAGQRPQQARRGRWLGKRPTQ
jgi:hypothetical protein